MMFGVHRERGSVVAWRFLRRLRQRMNRMSL
jgi:hypothetical protein